MPARKGFYADVRSLRSQVDDIRDGGTSRGTSWCVDSMSGNDTTNDGLSWSSPMDTMAEAFTRIGDGDRIYVRNGIYENLEAPAGITDISIIGVSTRPRHDNLTVAAKIGGAAWRTAAGVTDEPLLIVRSQGWRFENILMVGPSAEACVQLLRTATHDAGHAEFVGSRFAGGTHHIMASGGPSFVGLYDCRLEGATVASIGQVLGAGIGSHLQWELIGNRFMPHHADYAGNASHILMNVAKGWNIERNLFGTVASTALYIDMAGVDGGGGNNVSHNTLGGVYDTTDYVPGTGDTWLQNAVAVKATTAPDGRSLSVPVGP